MGLANIFFFPFYSLSLSLKYYQLCKNFYKTFPLAFSLMLFYTQFSLSLSFVFSAKFSCSVKTNLNSGGAVSKLYIANANKNDSGNYTCSLGETAQTTIAVHVLNGMYGLYVIYYIGRNNSPFFSFPAAIIVYSTHI